MKNLYLLLSAIVAAFFFSGCSAGTTNLKYNKKYVQGMETNGLAKINKKVVIIEQPNTVIKNDSVFSKIMHVYTNLDSNLAQNVSQDFLAQYFQTVEISNDEGFFEMDVNFEDIQYVRDGHQNRYKIWFDVKITQDKKVILNKSYYGEPIPPILFDSIYTFSPSTAAREWEHMVIHKSFFRLMEEQVKPDLLKALEENS